MGIVGAGSRSLESDCRGVTDQALLGALYVLSFQSLRHIVGPLCSQNGIPTIF